MKAWIGLGTNIGNGPMQIRTALEMLSRTSGLSVLRTSPLYRTEPWGFTGQPEFTNSVAELSIQLEPLELLKTLKEIELQLGRDPQARRWGPRKIDLDILLLGEKILHLPGLTVPHLRMHRRAFVLYPLFDLEPDLLIPAKGRLKSLIKRLDNRAVEKII